MKSSTLPTLFMCILFLVGDFACKKNDIIKANAVLNERQSIKTSSNSLVIASTDKSTTVMDAIAGKQVNYYKFLGNKKGNQSQSPLYTDSLIINFYGNIVTATRIKDSSTKWKTIIDSSYNGNFYQFTSYPCINDDLVMFYLELNQFRHQYGVYALNLSNGKVQWVNKDFVGSQSVPAYSKDLLIVNSFNYNSNSGSVYAIDIKNGKTKWEITHNSHVNSACIDDDKFYYTARTDDSPNGQVDTLFSRNIKDGSLNWKIQIPPIFYEL